MQNFQDTFETRKRSFISVFSICMTVPLSFYGTPFSFLQITVTTIADNVYEVKQIWTGTENIDICF